MYSVECYPDGGLREGRTSSWEWLGRVNNSSSLRIHHSTYINNKKLSLLRCQVKLWDDGLKTDKRDIEQVSDDNFYGFGNGSHLKSFYWSHRVDTWMSLEASRWIDWFVDRYTFRRRRMLVWLCRQEILPHCRFMRPNELFNARFHQLDLIFSFECIQWRMFCRFREVTSFAWIRLSGPHTFLWHDECHTLECQKWTRERNRTEWGWRNKSVTW